MLRASSDMEMASVRAQLAQKAADMARLEREKQAAVQVVWGGASLFTPTFPTVPYIFL